MRSWATDDLSFGLKIRHAWIRLTAYTYVCRVQGKPREGVIVDIDTSIFLCSWKIHVLVELSPCQLIDTYVPIL